MTKPVTGPSNLGDRGRRRPCRVPIERGGGREGANGPVFRGSRRPARRRTTRTEAAAAAAATVAVGSAAAAGNRDSLGCFLPNAKPEFRPSVRPSVPPSAHFPFSHSTLLQRPSAARPPSLPPTAPLTLISIRAHSLARSTRSAFSRSGA